MSLMTCEKERGGESKYFSFDYHQFLSIPQCGDSREFPTVQSICITKAGRIAVTWPVFNSAGKTSKGKGQVAILKVASLHLPLKGIRSFQILKQNIPNISSAEC